MFKDLKKLSFCESLLLIFPLSLILGPLYVNLFLIIFTILFFYKIFKEKTFYIFREKWIFFFLIFITYSIIRSFFAIDKFLALQSSFSLIRFISLSLFIFFNISDNRNLKIIIKYWLIILLLVSLDTLWQYFFMKDIFGYEKGMQGLRLSGPFGNGLRVGAYLAYISVPLIFYYFSQWKHFKFSKKIFLTLVYCILLVTTALTGERLGFLIFLASSIFIFAFYSSIKKCIYLLFFFTMFILGTFYFSSSFNKRMTDFSNTVLHFKDSSWGRLYHSGYLVFKNNYLFGAGMKNYRVVCDNIIVDPKPSSQHQFCSTHPHHIYLEILSEAGLFGFSILIFTFAELFYFIRRKIRKLNKNKIFQEYKGLLYGNILILLIYFWPLKTSGRFFTTWNGSFFWLSLGFILLLTKQINKNSISTNKLK
jgi:O-antigen ligase